MVKHILMLCTCASTKLESWCFQLVHSPGLTDSQLSLLQHSHLSSLYSPRPRSQYNLEDMASAYDECTNQTPGESLAKVARKYNVPRKTLENYVTGRTSIQTLYRKLGASNAPVQECSETNNIESIGCKAKMEYRYDHPEIIL